MSVETIEARIAEHRAAKDKAASEIAEIHEQRKRLLLAGDIDAIEDVDAKIRRLEISVEIAAARHASLNADLYLARAERQRWANVGATNFVMPDRDDLARLIEIVREAEPDLRFDDDEFRRAFWDASDLLRMRRQSSISGSAFLAAIIAHGDIFWQRGDQALGVVMALALNKNHGRPCSNRWRDIASARAGLLEPISPAGRRSSSYPTRPVRFYEQGADGQMHETDPIAPLWVQ